MIIFVQRTFKTNNNMATLFNTTEEIELPETMQTVNDWLDRLEEWGE